jgi:hypothetical protein
MALTNLGFEDDDAGTPGEGVPEAWTIIVTTAAEQVAAFGTETPAHDEERFESEWANDDYLFAFELADTAPPLFDLSVSPGQALEDFEEGWDGNQAYLFELNTGTDALFDPSTEPVEDFEEGWDSNESYSFTLGASTAASFDSSLTPQAFEDFSDGWSGTGAGNDYDFTMGAGVTAFFGAFVPDSYDSFEYAVPERQVTADPSTNLFTTGVAHGLVANDKVTFRVSGATPGALPAGLNSVFEYYVIASGLTGTTFRVALAAAGTQVDVTDAGVGVFYVAVDRAFHWVIEQP